MSRTMIMLPIGAFAGALVGVMFGSLWVQYQFFGSGGLNGDLFYLVKEFPGLDRSLNAPWRSGYQITGAAIVMTMIFVLILGFGHKLTEYGQTRFQTRAEMKRNGLLEPVGKGFVFAKLGKRFISSDWMKFPNCLMIAPPGAGKGVGFGIPNTLLFPGSTVILDVKGEIFEATSRYRKAQGDEIYYFSPFDFEHNSHRYNPLERVAEMKNSDQRFTELSKISTYFLATSEKGGASDFIVGARELFVAGGMLAIERGKPTIGEITRILFGGADKSEEYKARAAETKHPQTKAIFTDFSGYADRTLSSYVSVLKGAGLSLWLNPRIDHVTSANDFSWHTLRERPQSIYLVVNSDEVKTLAPLLRLIFGEFIATMRSSIPDPDKEPWPVGLFLDEFDQMGKLSELVQALKQLRGHGVRVTIITQSVPGLEKYYDENERRSIEAAASMKLYLTPNEKKTADEVSEAIGMTTKESTSESVSGGFTLHKRLTISRKNEERRLMTPDEVKKMDSSKVILIPERQNPILTNRIVYYEDPFFREIMKSQKGPLPYPDERHDMAVMREQIAQLQATVDKFQPISYQTATPASTAEHEEAPEEPQKASNPPKEAETTRENDSAKEDQPKADAQPQQATKPRKEPVAATTDAKTVMAEVAASDADLTEEEAREALRPSDHEKIKIAVNFDAKLKSKMRKSG